MVQAPRQQARRPAAGDLGQDQRGVRRPGLRVAAPPPPDDLRRQPSVRPGVGHRGARGHRPAHHARRHAVGLPAAARRHPAPGLPARGRQRVARQGQEAKALGGGARPRLQEAQGRRLALVVGRRERRRRRRRQPRPDRAHLREPAAAVPDRAPVHPRAARAPLASRGRRRAPAARRAAEPPAVLPLARRRQLLALLARGRPQGVRAPRLPRGGAAARRGAAAQAVPGAGARVDEGHGEPAARLERALLGGARLRRRRLLLLLAAAGRDASGGAARDARRAALRRDGPGQDTRAGQPDRRHARGANAAAGRAEHDRVARDAHRGARATRLAVDGRDRQERRRRLGAHLPQVHHRRPDQTRRPGAAARGGARRARHRHHDVPRDGQVRRRAAAHRVEARRARRDAGGALEHNRARQKVRAAARTSAVDGVGDAAVRQDLRPAGRTVLSARLALWGRPRRRVLAPRHRHAVAELRRRGARRAAGERAAGPRQRGALIPATACPALVADRPRPPPPAPAAHRRRCCCTA